MICELFEVCYFFSIFSVFSIFTICLHFFAVFRVLMKYDY